MGAVWMRLRAEVRGRWRPWVGLVLLAGLTGGLVTSAAAGARRTHSAYPRMLERSRPYDVIVYNYPDPEVAIIPPEQVESMPEVAESARVKLFFAGVGPGVAAVAPADETLGTRFELSRIMEGRRADPDVADEVTVGFAGAGEYGIEVGSTIPLLPSAEDFGSDPRLIDQTAELIRAGVPEEFRVVGIQLGSGDLPPITTGSGVVVYGTPALHEVDRKLELFEGEADSVLVRLERGARDIPSFKRRLDDLAPPGKIAVLIYQSDTTANVQRAVGPLSSAMWLLAGVLGVATMLILGQAIARQVAVSSDDDGSLRALGFAPAQIWGVAMARSLVLGAAAAVAATGIAVALSPLTPLGIARLAEPDPGILIDATALGVAAAAIVSALLILTAIPAWRAVRGVGSVSRPELTTGVARPATASAILSRAGAPPSLTSGAHLALSPGRGRTSLPVKSTILGISIGVAALCAGLGVGASFDHLLDSPRLYGQAWDAAITNFASDDFTEGALALKDDPGIEGLSYGGQGVFLAFGDKQTEGFAATPLKGDAHPPIVEGRRPRIAGEIALGGKTLREVGVRVGERIPVSFESGIAREMRIVGRVVSPAATSGRLGEFAFLDWESIRPLLPDVLGTSTVWWRYAEGVDRGEVLARIQRVLAEHAKNLPSLGVDPEQFLAPLPNDKPADVLNFGRVDNLPLILGAAFGALAAAVLAHMVSSSVRRRRRDVAILKTLGLGRRGIRAAIGWQATLLVAFALALGVPAGIAGGRWAWTALADRVGVLPAPRVPVAAVLLVVPAAIVLANLVVAIPGRIAARTQPALVLRAE